MLRTRLAVLLVTLGAALPALAAPFGARLTLFDDPSTSVAVSWNSDRAEDDRLFWGTSAGNLDRVATATGDRLADPLGYAFTVRLEGLTPGTAYHYRIGPAAGPIHPAAEAFSFTTLSDDPCSPVRIVVLGDNRADTDNVGPAQIWAAILDEAMAHAPDLLVNTGDMVKNGDRPVEWAAFLEESEAGFARVPSITTMGNHDEDALNGDGAMYNRLLELPRNDRTGTEDYFSLDVGPIHFVSVNTQFSRPGSTELTEMLAWLQADLAATQQPWKIGFFHKAIYSRGNHSSGEENDGALNLALVPLLDAYDVDLVFNGHSHDYERYAPSVGVDRAFGGTGRSFPAGDGAAVAALPSIPDGKVGTTYIVTGGAGALTTDVFGFTCKDAACTYCTGFNTQCPSEVFNNDKKGTVRYDGRHNFVVLDIYAETARAEVFTTAAGNTGAPERIDLFTLADPAFPAEICGGGSGGDGGVDGGPDGGADAGSLADAGFVADAGAVADAGTPHDAGTRVDAGLPAADAGIDAPDGGPGGEPGGSAGCGCASETGAPWSIAPFGLLLILATRRRRSACP